MCSVQNYANKMINDKIHLQKLDNEHLNNFFVPPIRPHHCQILIYATTVEKLYSSFGHHCHKYISQSVKLIYEHLDTSWNKTNRLQDIGATAQSEGWGDSICLDALAGRSLAHEHLAVFIQHYLQFLYALHVHIYIL